MRRDLYEGKYAPDPEGESRWSDEDTLLRKKRRKNADFLFRYLSEGGSCVLGSSWKIEELQYMIQYYTQDRMFRVELWF